MANASGANRGAESAFALFARQELGVRLDPSVVDHYIDEIVAEKELVRVKHVYLEQLQGLPSEEVARGLRSRLESVRDPDGLVRLLYAIGHGPSV